MILAQLPDIVSLDLIADVVRQIVTIGLYQLIGLMIIITVISRMIDNYFKDETEKQRKEKQDKRHLQDDSDDIGMMSFHEEEKETGDSFEYDMTPNSKGWKYD